MTFLIHITRLFLAIVLGAACIGKIAGWHNFEDAVANFGVPRIFVGPVAALVAIAEGLTFGFLVFSRTASVGAASAEILFLAFFTATVLNLSFGRHPECSCFGSIHSVPITWRTPFRSLGFAVLATVVFEHSHSVTQVLGFSQNREALAALAVGLLLLVFSAPIFRMPSRFRPRTVPATDVQGLPIGTPAPRFDVRLADGRHLDFGEMIERRAPMLFLFIAARCAACAKALSELSDWRSRQQKPISVLIVSRGDPAEIQRMAIVAGFKEVVIQKDGEIGGAYDVSATPSAVLIDSGGRIGSNLAVGAIGVNDLLRRIASTEVARTATASSAFPVSDRFDSQ